jgi:F0F1-type ATP synthase assembly protein I
MVLLITKYAVTAFVVVLVSELAKRSDRLGALVASLPFVTIMVLVWLHIEKQGTEKLANHAFYTFWYVIPTMPMFLLMPRLLHKGVGFWWSLLWCALLTFFCFVLTALAAKRFGVQLFP